MNRNQPSGMRAAAFAVTLFAITLNFLQPLAHAALMRAGGPEAAAQTWAVFCLPSAGEDSSQAPTPPVDKVHECCLGLAHAPALAAPPITFLLVEPAATPVRVAAETDVFTPVGIRDGPSQPRAPPFPV